MSFSRCLFSALYIVVCLEGRGSGRDLTDGKKKKKTHMVISSPV